MTLKITIGTAKYEIPIEKANGGYCFDIIRNGKIKSNTFCPEELKDNLKMYISEKLIIYAIYDINYEIGKLK